MPLLSDTLLDQLNEQIANELHASHLYLGMSAHFEAEDLPGFANWMRHQADEERAHAMRFYNHILDRDGRVELAAIEKPKSKWKDPEQVFEEALGHEREVTKQIYALYEAAEEEGDYALQVFLNWFVTEQVEEEQSADAILQKVRRVGKEPTGLMLLDKELEGRSGE